MKSQRPTIAVVRLESKLLASVPESTSRVHSRSMIANPRHNDMLQGDQLILFKSDIGETINIIRRLTPETTLFLLFMAQYIEISKKKTKKDVHLETIRTFFNEILKDEMFRSGNAKSLAEAVLYAVDIFGVSARNQTIQEHVVEIANLLGTPPEEDDVFHDTKGQISKAFLRNDSKGPLINICERIVKDALANRTLDEGIVMRLDRVYQRNLHIKTYHSPIYDEKSHRWETVDLWELMKLHEDKQTAFLEAEDIGVLRDLIMVAGKIWVFAKDRKFDEESMQTQMLIINEELGSPKAISIWDDAECDKLLKVEGARTRKLTLDQRMLQSYQQLKIYSLLALMLIELAKREKNIRKDLGGSGGLIDESIKKWCKLISVHSDLKQRLTNDPPTRPFILKLEELEAEKEITNDTKDQRAHSAHIDNEHTNSLMSETLNIGAPQQMFTDDDNNEENQPQKLEILPRVSDTQEIMSPKKDHSPQHGIYRQDDNDEENSLHIENIIVGSNKQEGQSPKNIPPQRDFEVEDSQAQISKKTNQISKPPQLDPHQITLLSNGKSESIASSQKDDAVRKKVQISPQTSESEKKNDSSKNGPQKKEFKQESEEINATLPSKGKKTDIPEQKADKRRQEKADERRQEKAVECGQGKAVEEEKKIDRVIAEPMKDAAPKSRRTGNKYKKEQAEQISQKENDLSSPPIILPKLRDTVRYHSFENLENAHSSTELKGYTFCLSPDGGQLIATCKDVTQRAALAIYQGESEYIQPIWLEHGHGSNVTIWNAAIFIYFDGKMARRFPFIGKQLKDHILYADLRETFMEEGSTKKIVLFYPVLKNDDGLINRAIIADEAGIFLLGGSRVANAKKLPVTVSKICSFYDLGEFTEIPMKSIGGNMNPMENKSEEITVAQNAGFLFAASRENSSTSRCESILIEVYDKEEDKWILQFKIPFDVNILSYDLMVLTDPKDGSEKLVFIGQTQNKGIVGTKIDVEKLIQSEEKQVPMSLQEAQRVTDSAGKEMTKNEMKRPIIRNNYDAVTVMPYLNFLKEQTFLEEYKCLDSS